MNGMPRPRICWRSIRSIRPIAPARPAQSASPIQSGQPDQPGRYVIARLAVLPEAQGRHIGSRLLADAERRIAQAGGTMAAVHSENDHYKFYEQRGYRLTDEVYEGGRHGWLVKDAIS
ncbi:MAG: GNAT family N-acetyltransferase [Bifidobacterium longum]